MMCNSSLVAPFARNESEFTGLDSAGSVVLVNSMLTSHKYKYVFIYLCGGKNKYESLTVLHLVSSDCVLISVNRKPHKGCALNCVDSLWFMPAC